MASANACRPPLCFIKEFYAPLIRNRSLLRFKLFDFIFSTQGYGLSWFSSGVAAWDFRVTCRLDFTCCYWATGVRKTACASIASYPEARHAQPFHCKSPAKSPGHVKSATRCAHDIPHPPLLLLLLATRCHRNRGRMRTSAKSASLPSSRAPGEGIKPRPKPSPSVGA